MKKKLAVLSLVGISLATLGSCTISRHVPEPGENGSSSGGVCEVVGEKFRVYFYSNGGSNVAPIEVEAGQTITKPDDPIYATHKFVGWYLNSQGKGEQFDFSKPITSNTVLYAKWESLGAEEIEAYNQEWLTKSEKDHLYIHYLRFNNTPEEYEAWDIWSWPYGGDGTNFDFKKGDNGKIITDELGGAYVDIDLTKTYSPAGWLNGGYVDGLTMSYMVNNNLVDKVGFQIVLKATRENKDAYWENDGDDNFITLSENKWDNGSYHVFCVQNNVPNYTSKYSAEKQENPYEKDDGNNTSTSNVNSSEKSKYGIAKTSEDFLNNAGVGYQVMVASFADSDGDGMGDIYGITKKLDYLKNTLHINTLWLTPIQLSDSYHAYDIIDYKVVDPKFGSKVSPNTSNGTPTEESAMKDYEDLLKEAEKRDIRVVMDLVLNHTSKKNTWFLKSSQLDPDYRSFYQWKKSSEVDGNKNWHQFSTTAYSYYGKFASSMPELNYDYQGTRDAMVDVAKFWMDKGVDGFRIDAVKHIYMADEVTKSSTDKIIEDFDKATNTDYSSNLTKNINFFQEFNARVKAVNPNALVLGENFDGNAVNNVAPYYQGLDSMFDFYMYYKLSNIAMGDSSGNHARAQSISNRTGDWCFPGVYAKYNEYRNGGAIESVFTSNHDVSRVMNMMVGSASNADDQTYGTVTSSNASKAIERAKCYATVMTMLPGITWIYYGDELGMTSNFASGETKTSPHVDRWYRQPYKFTNGTSGTLDSDGVYQTGFNFTGGAGFKIGYDSYNEDSLKSAQEQLTDVNSMLSYYSKLTELKSSSEALIHGSYTGISTSETVFAFSRTLGSETYYVYVNFGASSASVNLKTGTKVLSLGTVNGSSLGAHSAVIIKK